MTDKNKLIEIKELADAMYNEAFHLTTDASRLHGAMEKYHQFIIHEYHKEEPVNEDFEQALAKEWQSYIDRGAATVDALEDNTQELAFAKGFYRGAKWNFEHQWISVKDRLPIEEFDDGYTFVFVKVDVGEDTYRLETDYIRNGKWELHLNGNITHWMPIPPIPNKED